MSALTMLATMAAFAIGFLIAWVLRQSRLHQAQRQVESLQTEKRLTDERLAAEKGLAGQQQETLRQQFENLANRLLDSSSQKLTTQNQQQMQHLLAPLRDNLARFEKKIEDSYSKEANERSMLQGEIKKLVEFNQQMSQDAKSLTNALKGDVKTQGNWGEFQLSKILELSGLREGHEFTTQGRDMDLRNDDGQLLKPDVIINLPDTKHLIIDSKVSIKDYHLSTEATDDARRRQLLDAHVNSVRTHVEQLSKKHYQGLSKLASPDFVLLFMYSEPALAEALKHDRELFNDAWNRKIIIVSPTLLLAVLRTVASVWMHDRQTKNALKIAEEGGRLYDKFVGFVEDMNTIGKELQQVQRAYDAGMGKLQSAPGNLITKVEKLRELGAKTKKQLSAAGTAEEDNEETTILPPTSST